METSKLVTATIDIVVLDDANNELTTDRIKNALEASGNFNDSNQIVHLEVDDADDSNRFEYILYLFKKENYNLCLTNYEKLNRAEKSNLVEYFRGAGEGCSELIEFLTIKDWDYHLDEPTICWLEGSLDDIGCVKAKDKEEALRLAREEMKVKLEKLNEALKVTGTSLKMNLDNITVVEAQ